MLLLTFSLPKTGSQLTWLHCQENEPGSHSTQELGKLWEGDSCVAGKGKNIAASFFSLFLS